MSELQQINLISTFRPQLHLQDQGSLAETRRGITVVSQTDLESGLWLIFLYGLHWNPKVKSHAVIVWIHKVCFLKLSSLTPLVKTSGRCASWWNSNHLSTSVDIDAKLLICLHISRCLHLWGNGLPSVSMWGHWRESPSCWESEPVPSENSTFKNLCAL